MDIYVVTCAVDYEGKLSTGLASGKRLILHKADNSVSVHSDSLAYKPLNWISSPQHVSIPENGIGTWEVTGKKGQERLLIHVSEIHEKVTADLGEEPGLVKDAVEAELQKLLSQQIGAVLGDPAWTLIRREHPTPIGPIDMTANHPTQTPRTAAIEVKRIAGIDAVEQLTRYVEFLNRDPLLHPPVLGVLAAQEIKPQARTLAEDRGFRCILLDIDTLRGVTPENALF
jgi:RecB family endonuclease NucS